MNEKPEILIAEHLKDKNDLRNNRDPELEEGQEDMAELIADHIYEHAIEHGFETLQFYVSSKRRTTQTAELVKKIIDNKPIKLTIPPFEIDEDLQAIKQGKLILPPDYKPGDNFEGLVLAQNIFNNESWTNGGKGPGIVNYHFGDPIKLGEILQADDTYKEEYKYPELKECFSEPGESFKEMLLRYLSYVIKLYENKKLLSGKVMPVVVTHGQPNEFFRVFEEVAVLIGKKSLNPEPENFPRLCWNLYTKRDDDYDPGKTRFMSIENLCKPKIIELFKREIDYLKSI